MSKSIVIVTAALVSMTELHAKENGQSNNEETLDTHSQLLESEKKRRERQEIDRQQREKKRLEEEEKERKEAKKLKKLERELTMAELKARVKVLENQVANQTEQLKNCQPGYVPTPNQRQSGRTSSFDTPSSNKPLTAIPGLKSALGETTSTKSTDTR